LCKLCLTQAHSGSLQSTPAHDAVASYPTMANSHAHLLRQRPRSENPGVGGSIPSQPTIVFSPAGNDLARRPDPWRVLRPADSDGTRTDVLRAGGLGQRDDGGRGCLGLVECLELRGALLQDRLVHDRVAPVSVLCPSIFMAVDRGTRRLRIQRHFHVIHCEARTLSVGPGRW